MTGQFRYTEMLHILNLNFLLWKQYFPHRDSVRVKGDDAKETA